MRESHSKTCLVFLTFCALISSGCTPVCVPFTPHIAYSPNICSIKLLPEGFPDLDEREIFTAWGKELLIGQGFLKENDLYRAITALKRAKFLIPANKKLRRQQIDYTILLAYYVGTKYGDAICTYEESPLVDATPESFPPYDELLIILYDSYVKIGNCEKAEIILNGIKARNLDTGLSLELYEALSEGNIESSSVLAEEYSEGEPILDYLNDYRCHEKSVCKARTLNALLPGAGYYYVGQKNTAVTSFLINALFIAAAYSFFDHGNIAAGLITASFETGWYFGGINGAGLAAQEYNQRLYEVNTKEVLFQNRLFPVFHFTKSF